MAKLASSIVSLTEDLSYFVIHLRNCDNVLTSVESKHLCDLMLYPLVREISFDLIDKSAQI